MPLVQAALNGNATGAAVPVTPVQLAAAARAAVAAGARSLHVHPRRRDGRESLAAVDVAAAVEAVRAACPGVELGTTTGLWIADGDPVRRAALVAGWTVLPDMVSLNVDEAGAADLGAALVARGVRIEAGLTGPDEVTLLAAMGPVPLHRVLIEVGEPEPATAVAAAAATDAALDAAPIGAPRLHHGEGPATWAVVRAALAAGRDVRVGLEDVAVGPDGEPADNAAQVAAALGLLGSA